MNKEDADALLINIQTTSNKKARIHELGNGDHVVILKAQFMALMERRGLAHVSSSRGKGK